MVEVLLFVNIGLLVIGSVTLTIAVFVLQKARGYVELAEERLESLREGQERIFLFLREEQRSQSEVTLREESRPPEVQRGLEGKYTELEIEKLEKEPQKLRRGQENEPSVLSKSARSGNPPNEPAQNVGLLIGGESVAGTKNEKIPSTEKPRETVSAGLPKGMTEGKKSGFAVRHAHPDDDVSLQRERTKQNNPKNGVPAKMFREHYHRYLENYEGYVKLAERLCRMRQDGGMAPGSPAESEWEQKLRRLNDGIQRTTARLDILEQYNPELASDDRVYHRSEIAESYAVLEKKLSVLESS